MGHPGGPALSACRGHPRERRLRGPLRFERGPNVLDQHLQIQVVTGRRLEPMPHVERASVLVDRVSEQNSYADRCGRVSNLMPQRPRGSVVIVHDRAHDPAVGHPRPRRAEHRRRSAESAPTHRTARAGSGVTMEVRRKRAECRGLRPYGGLSDTRRPRGDFRGLHRRPLPSAPWAGKAMMVVSREGRDPAAERGVPRDHPGCTVVSPTRIATMLAVAPRFSPAALLLHSTRMSPGAFNVVTPARLHVSR
jgi:hypothetical protein